MKLIILTLTLLTITACSGTKVINGQEQTFTEFVILNKNSEWKGGWEQLEGDCFPGLRLWKWLEN
ncbi:MAG: hypothetical protein ACRCX2_32720 [Paraclostridium sp.]